MTKETYLESLIIHNRSHPSHWVEGLQAIAKSGSYAGACRRLYITRAALRQRLRNLSQVLGIEVWDSPYGNGGHISELGRAWLDKFNALPD